MIVIDKGENMTIDYLIEKLTQLQAQGHGGTEIFIFDSNVGEACGCHCWLDTAPDVTQSFPVKRIGGKKQNNGKKGAESLSAKKKGRSAKPLKNSLSP